MVNAVQTTHWSSTAERDNYGVTDCMEQGILDYKVIIIYYPNHLSHDDKLILWLLLSEILVTNKWINLAASPYSVRRCGLL